MQKIQLILNALVLKLHNPTDLGCWEARRSSDWKKDWASSAWATGSLAIRSMRCWQSSTPPDGFEHRQMYQPPSSSRGWRRGRGRTSWVSSKRPGRRWWWFGCRPSWAWPRIGSDWVGSPIWYWYGYRASPDVSECSEPVNWFEVEFFSEWISKLETDKFVCYSSFKLNWRL